MEEQGIVDRSNLRDLLEQQPEWTRKRMAEEIGRSLSWVKKWVKRIGEAEPDDDHVLHGRSRARKNPPPRLETQVVEKILENRDEPPENLRRTPGPKTILYYLQQDEKLKTKSCRLPRSTRTVWEVLKRNHRILGLPSKEPEPLERPEPWQEWGVGFKDVSSVPAEEGGKQQHVVEILNIIDHGTSALVDSQPHEAYTAETALMTLAEVIKKRGRPRSVTLDRDPRWVGSWQGKDFPYFWRWLARKLSPIGAAGNGAAPPDIVWGHDEGKQGEVTKTQNSTEPVLSLSKHSACSMDRGRGTALQTLNFTLQTFIDRGLQLQGLQLPPPGAQLQNISPD